MATKAYQAKEAKKKHQKKLAAAAFVGSAALSILTFLLPHSLAFLLPSLALLSICLIYLSWICYGLPETWKLRFFFFVVSISGVSYIARSIWPRLLVTPTEVAFRNNESFDFTLHNRTDDDYSIVNVEMEVIGDSDLSNFHLYMWPKPEDLRVPLADIEFTNDYDICDGADGKLYVVAIAKHLEADQKQRFTLRYKGHNRVVVKTSRPDGLILPVAYDAHQENAATSTGLSPFWLAKRYRNCKIMNYLKDRPAGVR